MALSLFKVNVAAVLMNFPEFACVDEMQHTSVVFSLLTPAAPPSNQNGL